MSFGGLTWHSADCPEILVFPARYKTNIPTGYGIPLAAVLKNNARLQHSLSTKMPDFTGLRPLGPNNSDSYDRGFFHWWIY